MSLIKHMAQEFGLHEQRVEQLYGSTHVANLSEAVFGGYINLGLWNDEGADYQQAAQRLVAAAGEALGLAHDSVLLDVGCGLGAPLIYLTQRTGAEAHGLDIVQQYVQQINDNAVALGLSARLHAHHGSGTNMPFPKGRFSHIMGIESTEHMETREQFLAEAARVLAPGGVLVITDFAVLRPPCSMAERISLELTRWACAVPKANLWSLVDWSDRLAQHGFMNVSVQRLGAKTILGFCRWHRNQLAQLSDKIEAMLVKQFERAYRSGLVDYLMVRGERP